jgi:hypothetical protein
MTERVALGGAFFGTHKNQARRPVQVWRPTRNDALQLKMNISHVAASRPRGAESCAFSRERVSHVTSDEAGPTPYAWKYALKTRIWSDDGPQTIQACRLLEVLLEHADAEGRAWPGIQALLRKTKIKTERTLQKALDELVQGGWLRIVRQTWASLTHAQTVAGKKAPRRGDTGQATNLYIVLDGQGRENTPKAQHHPGLISKKASNTDETTLQKDRGGPLQKDRGEPPANLQPDLDPMEDLSKEERAERATRVDPNTHLPSQNSKKREVHTDVWSVIVDAHAEKTKAVYGLPPLPPDLKRDQREALGALLDGAAVEVRAKIHARTGVERELGDVHRELASRVMHLYFKRDNEHLRRVKHALRDLPREFHARVTEAMQGLLRESHDAEPPRRPLLELPTSTVASADKPIETSPNKQHFEPQKRIESADKPVENVPSKAPKYAPPQPSSASLDTAREARRILEALGASPPPPELFRPSRDPVPGPHQATPVNNKAAEPEQACIVTNRSAEVDPSPTYFEQQQFGDKPSQKPQLAPHFERPLGRSGAPRWGAIGPRPTKMRCALRLQPSEENSNDTSEMRSSSGG